MKGRNLKFLVQAVIFLGLLLALSLGVCDLSGAEERKDGPIIVNGDTVEYSPGGKEVIATGNVEVIYKGSKLTCQKLTVNTETKDGVAEGNARLDDEKGVLEGSKIVYNFQTKKGALVEPKFRSYPYFGVAEEVNRVSEEEFIAKKSHLTTCDYDTPHYRIKSRDLDFFMGDRVVARGNSVYVGKIPVMYLPKYAHSFRDPLMHVQISPGKRSDWGPYVLTAWRYSLTDNLRGRVYLDYRSRLGVAEGFGANYETGSFGRGDFKYYYTQERPSKLQENEPAEFQRYLVRWRHKWAVDKRTDLTAEYYRITDSKRMVLGTDHNILKDYFFREYEKDSQPLTYALLHHYFNYASLDFLMQKRTNRWYSQLEKLPEIKYTLPNIKIAETPFYFENNSSFGNFNFKNAVPSPSTADVYTSRFDFTNKFSLPSKIAFLNFTPFVGSRETFYDRGADNNSISPRTIFLSGADLSTKFYRRFDVKSGLLGMDINGLRHIITPTVAYAYNHEPTEPSSKLKQIDTVDSITRSNAAALSLSNKLQTKREGQSVDVVDLLLTSTYTFKPKGESVRGSNLSDLLLDLKLLPYSWMRIDTDATYNHFDDHFSNVNYDLSFSFDDRGSFGIGQRYQRKGGNEITQSLNWRLSPKWYFTFYQRYNRGHDPALKRGIREQEYTLSRDLHCWIMDITYNVQKDQGETIYFTFRLKAFPELEFGFNQSYHAPKAGSQVNP